MKNIKKDDLQEAESGQGQISKKGMSSIVETLWYLTVFDVEATLRSICFKCLNDSGVSKDVRIKRAQGILLISEIFQKYAQSTEAGLSEVGQIFQPPNMSEEGE